MTKPRKSLRPKNPTIEQSPTNTILSEQALVERCKSGDHAAFAELIRRSSPLARHAIRNIAPNPFDAEDVMQDTLMNAFKSLRSFDGRSKFSTWLTRIAINNALMLLRRRRNRTEIELDSESIKGVDNTPLQLVHPGTNPEQALNRIQSINFTRAAIDALPELLREYAERHYLEDRTYKETASLLGISLPTVKSRSFRVRQHLRKILRRMGADRCSPTLRNGSPPSRNQVPSFC